MVIPYGDYVFTVTIRNAHLSTVQSFHLTFSQRGYQIVDLTDFTVVDDEHCTFSISQEQTSKFFGGEPISVQPNIILADGNRKPLAPKEIETAEQLLQEIIGGGNG